MIAIAMLSFFASLVICMVIAYRRQERAEREERRTAEERKGPATDAMIEVLSNRNNKLSSELDRLRTIVECVRATGWGSPSPARRARPLVYRISGDGEVALEGQTLQMVSPQPNYLEEDVMDDEEWAAILPIQKRMPRGQMKMLSPVKTAPADGERGNAVAAQSVDPLRI